MDVIGIVIGSLDILVGALVVALAHPLAQGKVAMNHWYGVRVSQSFESDEKWYRINRFGGRELRKWGLAIAILGVVALFLDLERSPWLLAFFLLVPLLVLIPAWRSLRYARGT